MARFHAQSHAPDLHRRVVALCAAVLLAGCAALPPSDDTQARAEMLAALDASAAAWNRGDLTGHLAIYDPAVTAMTRSGLRPGVAAIERSFRETYFRDGQPKQQLQMEQVQLRFVGRGAALMTGRFRLSGGGLAEQSGWFSLVWQQGPQGWKVVHDHSS